MWARISTGVRVDSAARHVANSAGAPRSVFAAAIGQRRHDVAQEHAFRIGAHDSLAPGRAASPIAAMPASAQASSWSPMSPEIPTAPTTAPSPSRMITPPGDGTARPWLVAASAVDERRRLRRALGQFARAEAHPERAPRLAVRDVETQEARPVLALEGDEVPAGVEHGGGQRREPPPAPLGERRGDQRRSLRERQAGHGQVLPE